MVEPNRKRICFCTTIASSMSTFVLPIIEELHKKGGYDITIICNPDKKLAESLPSYINYIPINMKRGLDILFALKVIKLIKVFRREGFDLVQYTTPNVSFYASIASLLCRVPVRFYCQWGLRYVGYNGIKRRVFKTIEKYTCKCSTHIQSASKKNMVFAINEGLCRKEKISIIGQGGTVGVDIEKFSLSNKNKWRKKIRKHYHIKDDAFVYGFVGRVNKDKGCNELLEAFQEIEKKQENVFLIIIGDLDYENNIRSDLDNYLKTSSNIIITKRIANEKIAEYYSAIDVLVHPTYREGFGMVIQEAGALGIPTITTNIPGASEVMINNESTILVPPRNVQKLTVMMLKVKKDNVFRSQLGNNAYKRTIKYYNRENMLILQTKKYQELMAKYEVQK